MSAIALLGGNPGASCNNQGKWRMTMIIFKRFILLSLVSVFLQCSSAWAQFAGTGIVDEVRRDEGWISINNIEYDFRANQMRVVYKGEPTRLVYVQEGIRVRFRTDVDGYITQLTLVGPEDKLSIIKNQ